MNLRTPFVSAGWRLGLLAALTLTGLPRASTQMVTGTDIPGFEKTFGVVLHQRTYPYSVQLITCSAPGNILVSGEQAAFTFQIRNNTEQPIRQKAKVVLIHYATRGRPGDIWVPDMFKIADVGSVPLNLDVPPKGFQNVTITPRLPAKFGAYALVTDLGALGRQFLATCVRTFPASSRRIQYPKFCLDAINLDVLKRLGVQAIRYGVEYKPTTDKDFPAWFAEQSRRLKAFQAANIAVLFMVGAPDWFQPHQPLGRPRPWLDDHDVMLDTKTDIAWLPSYDADFQNYCKRFATQFGWPKGPINAFSLWNEPWEGISISGWGADMLRYREMYTHMAQAILQARKEAGVQVLVGGCDSSSNALDKLFGDGSDQFLPVFDFLSIHYQGLSPDSTVKKWVNRKSPYGRVKIWDTESWVANTDDRVAAVVAANRAAGYDRAMGIYGGNIAEEQEGDILLADGKTKRVKVVQAWSVAASVGACQHFIGERDFKELLFKNGLPWVMVFHGAEHNPEDGTVVVVGDLGEEFGADNLLFRTARGLKEIAHKAALKRRLAALPANAPEKERTELRTALAKDETLSGATMTINAEGGRFSLYDFYGNPVPPLHGKIVVPLDGRGFFLRGNGRPGSFAALLRAVQTARIEGIEPLATVARDMTAPIEQHPTLRLSLTNVLNRPVSGTLQVTLGALQVVAPQTLHFQPHETKQVPVKIVGGTTTPSNTYLLVLRFDAGRDGRVIHEEEMHVNLIAHRAIQVDGNLDDWKDVPAQTVRTFEKAVPSQTEAAWFPFKKFDAALKQGFATGYLAYDANYFYFAAKIADNTPDDGMVRFETRDEDAYFYPETSYHVDDDKTLEKKDVTYEPATKDIRALRKPDSHSDDRIAAAWATTHKQFALDLKLTDGKTHQVALYLMDWDDPGSRNVKITITDTATGKLLDERDIDRLRFGKYVVYNLSGSLRIILRTNTWRDATLSGIFFDAPKAAARLADGSNAAFVKIDEETQGDWPGVYGAEGYNVIGTAPRYPAYVSLSVPTVVQKEALTWPQGVRRYSYRKDPELPSGNFPDHDNVQIAFNVLPPERKSLYPCPPGTMPGFVNYEDTDYEYALNPVAPKYGGGTEIWRLAAPGMPHKHFYPRQPKSPLDGPVKEGKLVIRRDGNTRLVEAALHWTEIPEVKKRLDAGQPIKFSFRVNDNANLGCMELSKRRSVAKRNGSFHVDWVEHWANELEFGWQK